MARSLASKRTQTIALLYPTLIKGHSDARFDFVIRAAEVSAQHGYAFLLWTAPNNESDILQLTQQGRVDGLILMEVHLHDSRVELLKKQQYPFSLIGHCANNDGISFVDLDFEHAVATAVDHLVELGVVVITRNTNLLDLDVWVGLDEVLDGLHLIIPVGDGQRVIGTARGAVRGAAGRGTRQRGDGGDACHQAKGVALHVDVHVVSFLPATTLDFETQL